ncbi:hypothetical protein QYE76_066507 [Lolium multiflorum]|uniref:Integrase catalytic domain-containing protein n=1 Tax=Lolium multiflorum TaxID=4521 RepID=A0AAD8SCR9_LOLMU|nr:hypothetical protein QYE76_066507 [Lolium multiflorum]
MPPRRQVAAAAAFLREGRMPPRSTHPRHQQHKPLRRGGGGAAAWRRRGRLRVKEEEPPPLPSSSTSSSTPTRPLPLPLPGPSSNSIVGELHLSPPLPLPLPLSNDEADVLANIGSQCLAIPPGVFWEEISERSTKARKQPKKKEKVEKGSGASAALEAGASGDEENRMRFAAKPHSPAAELMPIPLSWRFAQWGLDMVGKLHKVWPGGYEYMLVAVDKFTKWVEAKPINSPDAASAVKFIKSIVFRFGVPHSIVTDNGSNFTSKEFKAYCAEVGIKLHFASVAHPQTNGQVEKANGVICNGIKKRLLGPLEKARHTWPEELPSVLWSIRTTPNTATQETPFFLVHGAEAVLPIEIEHNSSRVAEFNEETSRKALEDDVDALDEARDEVLSRVAKYQQDMKNYHSRQLRPRSFQVGDLVLRLTQDSHEKFESPWLGPYIVTEVIEGGAYMIKDKKTGIGAKSWNVAQLRRFYA